MTNTLIIGAGITGAAAAHELTRLGHQVELIEIGDELRVLGSGITLIAPALRALDRLGVLQECMAEGYGVTEFKICDPHGEEIVTLPLPSAIGPGEPGLMGMMRPRLHQILLDKAIAGGATVRTGIGPKDIEINEDHATVTFTDGTVDTYDLVVGADGLYSTVRPMLFSDATPVFRGQGCYRAVVSRQPEVTKEHDFSGCPTAHPGFTPTGEDSMYVYCNVPAPTPDRPAPADMPAIMREHLAPFGGIVARVREEILDPDKVNYALFETILVEEPWNKGCVVLIGDAAHSTTPQLAAGGAMCLEDVVALGEELAAEPQIPVALENFFKRRFERCKYVIDSSVQLSAWQLAHHIGEDPANLTAEAFATLAEPF
jgi:2-polyprenyl-6-methoxyphenol hydroxylase-like FAD-dependent oxidoreductase